MRSVKNRGDPPDPSLAACGINFLSDGGSPPYPFAWRDGPCSRQLVDYCVIGHTDVWCRPAGLFAGVVPLPNLVDRSGKFATIFAKHTQFVQDYQRNQAMEPHLYKDGSRCFNTKYNSQ